MGVKVTKIKCDTRPWEKMKRNLLKGKDQAINVGFFEDSPSYDNGLHVSYVAKVNEEGVGVPMRSFIRGGFMLHFNTQMYHGHFRQMLQRIAEGKSSFAKEYSILGPIFKEDMQEVIEEWTQPPNSEITKRIKGRDDPLVDSSLMRDSVDFKIGSKHE